MPQPTDAQMLRHVRKVLSEVQGLLMPPEGVPPFEGLQVALTGSAALWCALVTSGRSPGWHPTDIDIPIQKSMFAAAQASLSHHWPRDSDNGRGSRYHHRYNNSYMDRLGLPQVQIYPVDDVEESIQLHDLEAVRLRGEMCNGLLKLTFSEGVDGTGVIDHQQSDFFGVEHRCVNAELTREVRITKYTRRGFHICRGAPGVRAQCPYCATITTTV
jgi:hypothetical protein